MKIEIDLPDDLFKEIDLTALCHKTTRNAVINTSCRYYLFILKTFAPVSISLLKSITGKLVISEGSEEDEKPV